MTIVNRTPPIRLQIMMALQALLEEISELDGDAFTLAERVHRNRAILGEDVTGDPPILAIIEAPRPDAAFFAGEDNKMRKDLWTLMIQGQARDDRLDTNDDIWFLCQDVERRLARIGKTRKETGKPYYPESYMLGGKITTVEIAPPVVRPAEAQVSRNSFFYIPIRVGVALEIGE